MAKKSSDTPARKAVRKSAPTKAAASAEVKPVAASKTAVKKTATKKVAVKKAPARKAPAGKAAITTAAPPPTVTTVVAKTDVGFGNSLYLRGSGAGLSWEKGVLMGNASSDEWVWSSDSVKGSLEFKVLINDEIWADGENCTVNAGDRAVVRPGF